MADPASYPPAAAPAAVSLVETDAFCECGYNLHGQRVWRDERLGILVCRCPECGRHAAAGRFTGIHSVWLHRVSTALVVGWVAVLLGVFGLITVMMGVWPSAYVGPYLEYVEVQPTTTVGVVPRVYRYDLWERPDVDQNHGVRFAVGMYGMAAGTGGLTGVLVAVLLWHLRGKAYWALVLPGVAAGVVWWGWWVGGMSARARQWVGGQVAAFFLVECVGIVVGLWVGRAVARWVLGMLLPPRLLQHLAFLWYRDGVGMKEKRGH